MLPCLQTIHNPLETVGDPFLGEIDQKPEFLFRQPEVSQQYPECHLRHAVEGL